MKKEDPRKILVVHTFGPLESVKGLLGRSLRILKWIILILLVALALIIYQVYAAVALAFASIVALASSVLPLIAGWAVIAVVSIGLGKIPKSEIIVAKLGFGAGYIMFLIGAIWLPGAFFCDSVSPGVYNKGGIILKCNGPGHIGAALMLMLIAAMIMFMAKVGFDPNGYAERMSRPGTLFATLLWLANILVLVALFVIYPQPSMRGNPWDSPFGIWLTKALSPVVPDPFDITFFFFLAIGFICGIIAVFIRIFRCGFSWALISAILGVIFNVAIPFIFFPAIKQFYNSFPR